MRWGAENNTLQQVQLRQADRGKVALTAVQSSVRLAVVGAGPVGLALALHAATLLPHATITLFDARTLEHDVARDPRTLALALGSVQLLQRLQAWPEAAAQSILEVHVSQASPSWRGGEVTLRASELAVPRLGAVLSYGALVHALQQRWLALALAEPQRLRSCFGTAVSGLDNVIGGVTLDAGIHEAFDLAVIAEGGVFAEQSRKSLTHDYAQTAWVGGVTRSGAAAGVAIERFTRAGPLALLPLPDGVDGTQRAALVWCVASADDPVRELDQSRRLVLLRSLLPPQAGQLLSVSPLKAFALGLNAERSLVQGRTVRIGNAAQTLHPVAGQGLNLGLRDAVELVTRLRFSSDVDAALTGVVWARGLDRWSTIAGTDFLARSFALQAPVVALARGAALSLLQASSPAKAWLARHMMFGWR